MDNTEMLRTLFDVAGGYFIGIEVMTYGYEGMVDGMGLVAFLGIFCIVSGKILEETLSTEV